jgi:hypothetical protein
MMQSCRKLITGKTWNGVLQEARHLNSQNGHCSLGEGMFLLVGVVLERSESSNNH